MQYALGRCSPLVPGRGPGLVPVELCSQCRRSRTHTKTQGISPAGFIRSVGIGMVQRPLVMNGCAAGGHRTGDPVTVIDAFCLQSVYARIMVEPVMR